MDKLNSRQFLPNSYNIRIFLLLGLITVFIGFIAARLYNLQVLNHDTYLAQASTQHGMDNIIPAKRGEIYLSPESDGKQPMLVATNISQNLVFATTKVMSADDQKLAVAKLAPILGFSNKDLADKLASGNSSYLPLKHQVSDADAQKIKDLKLKGISLEPEIVRYYPQKNLASQVLGFLGYDGDARVGQYGVEGKYEKELAGQPGIAGAASLSNSWLSFEGEGQLSPKDGSDIYLTLNPAIQFKAQEVLADTVTKHSASSGSVIVMNPKTGAVMAMASYPDFDPNQYSKVSDTSVYNNIALSSDYEPGSVFKAITMGIGLNEGKINPQSTYIDTGFIQVDDRVIKNSDPKPRGLQTMTQVLDESLNTGAAYVENLVGHDKFKEYVEKFGFGKQVGSDLPGETKGNLDNLNRKGDIWYATASFGQGISTTPIQLAAAYSAIANGGEMMQPYIVDKIVKHDGTVDQKKPTAVAKILDSKTAATLSAMLVDVVENGHGKHAGVKGYYIGGKTGTAQVAYKDRQGYDPNKNIGTFVGFGPVDNPAFVMLVRIDDPKDVTFAEASAAPAFGEIASFILNYLQIPPSRP